MSPDSATGASHELSITRLIDAPRATLFRCWTDPELMKEWFCPKPWVVSHAELDVRSGGGSLVVMRSPDGTEHPHPGIYLEVVPAERLVFTDAYTAGWVPTEKPFMTGIITFADEGGKTRYTARARHWSEADRQRHEEMGFHQGWGICADQLEALAKTL